MSEKFEIYKVAVEMADRVSARRMVANGFFITVNTTLVSLLGFMYSNFAGHKRAVLFGVAAVGLLVSLTWLLAIRSYKLLNSAKWSVINDMEKSMSYDYFTKEWEKLSKRKSKWRWLRFKDRYSELTKVEALVPILFGLLYLLVLIGAWFKVIIK